MISCSCDGSGPEVFWESWPTARKKHQCCECGSDIDPGERYKSNRGIWEGDFATFKQCEICAIVFERALNHLPLFGCVCFEQLWETVGVWGEELYQLTRELEARGLA